MAPNYLRRIETHDDKAAGHRPDALPEISGRHSHRGHTRRPRPDATTAKDQVRGTMTRPITCLFTRPIVDAGGLKPNTWQRFERLGSAWNQAKLGVRDEPQGAVEDEPGVAANPRRRARTPLTDSEVDAIRTARANGESVVSISRRFGIHRMTIWEHTKGSRKAR